MSNNNQTKSGGQSAQDAIILWTVGIVCCPVIMLLFPRIIGLFNLYFLIAPVASIALAIAGGICYKKKTFSKKEELKKSLVKFRVAYSISWLLFAIYVGAVAIIMSFCKGWDCILVLLFAPSVLPLMVYSITFMVIASKLKKKLS